MGQALKFNIIAEGVETRAQMDVLRAIGCDIGRSNYIGHAIQHEEFVRLLQTGIQLESRIRAERLFLMARFLRR